MTRVVALAAMLFALVPQQKQVFRSGAEGVRADVLATDGRAPVAGLKAGDFVLLDNGVPQTIETVEFGDVPLSVILALDISGSVEGTRLEHLKTAVTRALDTLTSRDTAAFLAFRHDMALSEFTTDRRGLVALVQRAAGEGATSLHDAAYGALLRSDSRLGRPLVLLFSDGQDTASWLPADAVYNAAHRSDAVVYAVSLRDKEPTGPFAIDHAARLPLGLPLIGKNKPFLDFLAEETGGRVFLADKSEDIESRFLEALKEFKSRYLITYTPQGVDTAGWHELQVRVKRPGVKVAARRGYQR